MYRERKMIIIILTYLHILQLQSAINFLKVLGFLADLISYGSNLMICTWIIYFIRSALKFPFYWVVNHLFFSIWVFFHEHSRITGLQVKREGISLSPLYHFHLLHGRLGISRVIIAGGSPLRIVSSRSRTGNLGFRAQVANH